MLISGVLISLGAALGVSSHLGYFMHGEHHMQAVRLLLLLLTSPLALFTIIISFDEHVSASIAIQKTATVLLSFFFSLTASILIYRIFFHPLRHFPGPFTAKLTKISHVLRLLKTSDNYVQADRLHKKYGNIVR